MSTLATLPIEATVDAIDGENQPLPSCGRDKTGTTFPPYGTCAQTEAARALPSGADVSLGNYVGSLRDPDSNRSRAGLHVRSQPYKTDHGQTRCKELTV